MKSFPTLNYIGVFAFFLLLFAAPAFAQFEVSPDHFDGPQQTNAKPAKTAVKAPAKKKAESQVSAASPNTKDKSSASKIGAAKNTSARKPHPGKKSASASATAKDNGQSGIPRGKSTSAQLTTSLKGQAPRVPRE